MNVVVTTSLLAIALIGLVAWLRSKMEPEASSEPEHSWHVRVYDPKGIMVRDFTYPCTIHDEIALQSAVDASAEIEDEAASYASFEFFMQLPNLTEEYSARVTHSLFGDFRFRPDFDHGHLVGVKEYVMHGSIEKEVGVIEQLR